MATFYLLPPRACLEQAVSELFGKLLPGLPLPADAWDAMAEHFGAIGGWADDVFLVPRDELPEGDPGEALAGCYGAEPGDRVVEVSLARPARAWALPAGVSGATAAR
jgi:hypothetical protein